MQFTKEETKKLKAMMHFIVKKQHIESDGHSGFHLKHLQPILDEMVEDKTLVLRPTIHTNKYFLTPNTI